MISKAHFGFIPFWFLIVVIVVGAAIYALVNFSKYGDFLARPDYSSVNISELFSYGNFYSGKRVCTAGYYVEADGLNILKISLDEDRFTRTAWVDLADHEIITKIPGAGTRAVLTEICGKFEASRSGEFGEPPVWIAQITVDTYKTLEDPKEVTIL